MVNNYLKMIVLACIDLCALSPLKTIYRMILFGKKCFVAQKEIRNYLVHCRVADLRGTERVFSPPIFGQIP